MNPQQLAQLLAPMSPQDRAALFTSLQHGFDHHVGLRFTWAAADRVVAELTVADHHTQPYGLCHGGVYCTLAEACCSVGAALSVMDQGHHAVGVDNHTRFLRAARPGAVLTVVAEPAGSGVPSSAPGDGRHRTWTARITDQQGTLCAEGQVRVRALPAGSRVGGQAVALHAALPDDSQ